MADFTVNNEYDKNDPDIVTKMHCTFEPSMNANRIHAFLADLERSAKEEYCAQTVLEEMRRIEGKLYVCVGFRELDSEEGIEKDEDECMGK